MSGQAPLEGRDLEQCNGLARWVPAQNSLFLLDGTKSA
jgi:hypothetical protein